MGWRDRARGASGHIRKSRNSKAIAQYRESLSAAPNDPELRAQLADAYRDDGNAERAFHHYVKAAQNFQNVEMAPDALKMLRQANTVQPNQPDILYRLAECALSLNMWKEAETALFSLTSRASAKGDRRRLWALEQLRLLRRNDVEIVEHLAEAFAEADQLDESVQAFNDAAATHPRGHAEAHRLLMRAATLAGERPDLVAFITGALVTAGHPRQALTTLLEVYGEHRDNIAVLQALLLALEAIGATQKIIPARIELLKARATQGQYSETLRDVDALMALAGDEPTTLEVCAHACSIFGETVRAASLWRSAMRISSDPVRRLNAAQALLRCVPDDEEGLRLAVTLLEGAGRGDEAATFRRSLAELDTARAQPATPAPASPPVLSLDHLIEVDSSAPAPIARPASQVPTGAVDQPLFADPDVTDHEVGPPRAPVAAPMLSAASSASAAANPELYGDDEHANHEGSDLFALKPSLNSTRGNATPQQVHAPEPLFDDEPPLVRPTELDTPQHPDLEPATVPAVNSVDLVADLLTPAPGPKKGP